MNPTTLPVQPDLTAIEAAHDALWQNLRHPPLHLPGPAVQERRDALNADMQRLMRPILEADPTHLELTALGYTLTQSHAQPYHAANGDWYQTGCHRYQRGNIELTLWPPRQPVPTLAATLALPGELGALATGPVIQGGPGLHKRLRDAARQIAQQLQADGLHGRVLSIQLTNERRQHPNTNSEGINYSSSGRSSVGRYYDTAAFL